MQVLKWKHSTTREAAKRAVQAELQKLGFSGKVTWKGDVCTATGPKGGSISLAFTDDTIVVEKAGEKGGAGALKKCRTLLGRLFANGEQK